MNGLTEKSSLKLLRQLLLCRRFEEACIKGYQQKNITGFCHTYIGQEAVAVGSLIHLTKEDAVVTSYRCHAQALLLDISPRSAMAELYGKITGCARGKGGSMHLFSKERNLLGGHGIVGGQIPIGTGAAFANRYLGGKGVTLTFFGDGASVQGTFHESVNLAALWNIPNIFICENNQYGMGTAANRAVANTNIADQAAGYGIKGYTIDGLNVITVFNEMKKIIAEVRKTSQPVIVDMKTYRFKGHSVSDAGLYRSKKELQSYLDNDCILKFVSEMKKQSWINDEKYKELDKEIKEEIKDAVEFAKNSPFPPIDELTKHVYKD